MPSRPKPPGIRVPELKSGDVLTAEWCNSVARAIQAYGVQVAWPLKFSPSGRGGTFSVDIDSAAVLIKTTSAITARSGTTVGTGSAQLVTLSGSTLVTGATITLKNVSGTAGATGKYGWARQLANGTYVLVSLEC